MLPDLAVRIPGRPRPGLGGSSIIFAWAPFVFRVARSGAGLGNMPTDGDADDADGDDDGDADD